MCWLNKDDGVFHDTVINQPLVRNNLQRYLFKLEFIIGFLLREVHQALCGGVPELCRKIIQKHLETYVLTHNDTNFVHLSRLLFIEYNRYADWIQIWSLREHLPPNCCCILCILWGWWWVRDVERNCRVGHALENDFRGTPEMSEQLLPLGLGYQDIIFV
jgi:hypothetical protein